MTPELQRAMAEYERARLHYRKTVLGSLSGTASGEAIRQSIVEFRKASAELGWLTGSPGRPQAKRFRSEGRRAVVPTGFPVTALVRWLLDAW